FACMTDGGLHARLAENAALRQQLLVAQAEVKRLREAGKRCRKEMERRGLLGEANFILREMDISSDTSAIDSLQRGADRYKWWRSHASDDMQWHLFGCAVSTPEEMDERTDAAIGASHEVL
ncbi:MAG: hypothetical protein WC713_02005, partial [Candidatus Methylomirabilota bacterium]